MTTANPDPPIPGQYDKTYRLLYSYPEMVEDTLRLINEPWVDELDFSTLKKMAESYVSERLDLRFEDVVWKVRWRGCDVYLCLLIEFQSTVDQVVAELPEIRNVIQDQHVAIHEYRPPLETAQVRNEEAGEREIRRLQLVAFAPHQIAELRKLQRSNGNRGPRTSLNRICKHIERHRFARIEAYENPHGGTVGISHRTKTSQIFSQHHSFE